MKPLSSISLVIATLAALLGVVLPVTTSAAQSPVIVTPNKIHWMQGTGSLKGAQVAVIDGNPMSTGEYTIRIKIPDGMRLPVHFHGHPERVTVLSGTLLVSVGDKVVPASRMLALGEGSYVDVPPGLHHYAMARGETVIQVSSEGPRSMTIVEHKKM
jgi:mannose-6-phosphate isomerase-like protein (cupin superfamily)